jgi:transcriptional regulator with XRE-family HTH domain
MPSRTWNGEGALPGFETLEKLSEALETPLRDFFDLDRTMTARAAVKRVPLMTTLLDAARCLTDSDSEIAVQQVEALARRRSTSRPATKAVPSGKH